MMMRKHTPPADPGLQAIADLEATIILSHEQSWDVPGVSDAERLRFRLEVAALAKHVCDRLRSEYRARTSGT